MDKKKRSGNISGILLQSKFKTNKNNKKEKTISLLLYDLRLN